MKLNCLRSASSGSVLHALPRGSFVLKWFDCLCVAICLYVYPFSQAHTQFFVLCFLCIFTAMHLFGLNWQLQELDNQPAFENGGAGKTGPTHSSVVTALAADGEATRLACLHEVQVNIYFLRLVFRMYLGQRSLHCFLSISVGTSCYWVLISNSVKTNYLHNYLFYFSF